MNRAETVFILSGDTYERRVTRAGPKAIPPILALADDMTGALEIGAKFSGAGIRTLVSARPLSAGTAPVVVLDTETRHVDEGVARREIRRFIAASGSSLPRLIYKKTDSTLRGNIKAELQALTELFPDWSVGYAPAYPALGRTVKSGILYVHGRPVSLTEFAGDQLNPVRSSSVLQMMKDHGGCTVFDSESDEELEEVARTILSDENMRIAAGPSGLAGIIAAKMDISHGEPPSMPTVSTCLLVNGSRHPFSAAQVRDVVGTGWQVLTVVTAQGTSAGETAAANSRHLVSETLRQNPDAILVIGGDTAFAVVRELGLPQLTPVAEIVPGVPVTRIEVSQIRQTLPGRKRELILITKAGGFGESDVLHRVKAKLSHDARQ